MMTILILMEGTNSCLRQSIVIPAQERMASKFSVLSVENGQQFTTLVGVH